MRRLSPVHCSLFVLGSSFVGLSSGCATSQTAVGEDRTASAVEAAFVRAEESSGFHAKQGFFVQGLGVAATLEKDDFDGNGGGTFANGTEGTIAPELDTGTGWGIAIGWRGVSNSFQYTYTTTEHESESVLTNGDDTFNTYSLDFKHHFNVDGRFQPFALVGVTVPRLIVEGGTFDAGFTTQLGDAKYQGLGVNLGAGAALYLTEGIALVGEGFYRWAYFNEVTGVNDDGNVRGDLDASGFGLRAGVSFTF